MHLCLPQTMTAENLGAWIADNNIEKKMHEEKYDLTPEEIAGFEHDSSAASREIDKLDKVKDTFMKLYKKGTDFDIDKEIFLPATVVIPGTKGVEILSANREFADAQITLGYRTELTQLYGIPYPETKKIIFVDITGGHWENYDYKMNPPQLEKYGKPLLAGMTGKSKKISDEEKELFGDEEDLSLPFAQ